MTTPRAVSSRHSGPTRAARVTSASSTTGSRAARRSSVATKEAAVAKPAGWPARSSPDTRFAQFGVLSRNESHLCVRQLDPVRPRSRTTCLYPARASSPLTAIPAGPAPTTAARTHWIVPAAMRSRACISPSTLAVFARRGKGVGPPVDVRPATLLCAGDARRLRRERPGPFGGVEKGAAKRPPELVPAGDARA